MSNRRKYEGEEELQLQLLEVTQDPTFGESVPQRNKWLLARGEAESTVADEVDMPTVRAVH